MNKLGRAPFYTVWFYVVLCSFVTWQELYSRISPEDYRILLVFRIFLLGSALPVGYYLRKNPFSVWANSFICMNFMVYSMVGHYYLPLYYACFLQTLYAFSFLFLTSRRLHFILISLKAGGFAAFYLLTYDLIKYPHGAETKEDFLATIIIAWVLGILVHYLFTAERGLKESAHDRFSLLGRHASHIVHDIKGSISIPHLYLNEAHKSLESQDYKQVKDYLSKMESSLSRVEKTIFDLNQLSRMTEESDETFKVSEGLSDVLDMLAKRLHDIEIKVEGDFDVKGNRGIICSVFLNLILNSLEIFRSSKTQNPKIEIKMNANSRTISFTDNGGGFSKEALSSLKGNQFVSTSTSNSGLGLYLVRENLRTLKGRVSFQNINHGAQVEIKLG